MTTQQIIAVKRSWALFRNIDPVLIGEVFYSRIFFKVPALKKMFPTSMEAQYNKIIDMLSLMVARLERMDELTNEITALAQRHVKYGVKTWHYGIVEDALLWTLEQGLGRDYTDDVKEAWGSYIKDLSATMIKAAEMIH
ncbi:MAG: globin domain-containing protein [Ferruginibacter sp.]